MKVSEGMGARTRNAHATAAVMFGNWAVKAGRLAVNPFTGVPMMNVESDRRRERRVLTLEEFVTLVDAAERRTRDTWLGKSRKMIYSVLMFTGLRYSELRSITIGQVRLDAAVPHIELRARDEKARRGAQVPLPAGLAEYVAERRARFLGQRGASSNVVRFRDNVDAAPLFEMPRNMAHLLDADLKAAGIPKADAQGRTVDVHALRHSFCTMIAQSGVNTQTAQRLMRHATPAMTMRYTHMTLTDLGGAIATLPTLPEISQLAVAAAESASSLRPIGGRISVSQGAIRCTIDTQDCGDMQVGESGEKPNKHGTLLMVGEEGVEPSTFSKERILSPPCMPFHHSPA